eukprot:29101_1
MYCQYCGFNNEAVGANFCNSCGKKLLKNKVEGFKQPLIKNSINAADSDAQLPAFGSYAQSYVVEPIVIPNNQEQKEQKQNYMLIIVKKFEYASSCENGS